MIGEVDVEVAEVTEVKEVVEAEVVEEVVAARVDVEGVLVGLVLEECCAGVDNVAKRKYPGSRTTSTRMTRTTNNFALRGLLAPCSDPSVLRDLPVFIISDEPVCGPL